MWDGKRYESLASPSQVRCIIVHQLSTVYKRVRDELFKELAKTTDKERAAELEAALKISSSTIARMRSIRP
jgi:hypothetical protein